MVIQAGDPVPDVILYEGDPDGKVRLTEFFRGKKGVLYGVVGAFTPTCSRTHLPELVRQYPGLVRLGVSPDAVACLSVNDPYVLGCWGQAHGTDGKIIMLADPKGQFVKEAGLQLDLSESLGDVRSHRFAMIVEDGIVLDLVVEDPKAKRCLSLTASISEKLEKIEAAKAETAGVGDI